MFEMTQERRLVDMRRWLDPAKTPTMNYYFELYTGERGESDSPLCLFDLLVEPEYSDCDDRATHLIMLGRFARDGAVRHLAAQKIRATVFDGMGPFYDPAVSRFQDEMEEEGELEFTNPDDPLILDFWDEWTLMASLIRSGYLRLFEKVTTFGAMHQEQDCTSCYFYDDSENRCAAWNAENVAGRMEKICPFWTEPFSLGEYIEVTPDKLSVEPTWKPNYIPVVSRTKEYEGFRRR